MRKRILVITAATGLLGALLVHANVDVLARIGNQSITPSEFRQEMVRRGGNLPGQYATVEQRLALLQEMIEFEGLAAAALRAGYDSDPEILALFKKLLVARYQRDMLDQRLALLEVSDEDVAEFYREHLDEFTQAERVQAALVFIRIPANASPEKRVELEQRAQAALAAARDLTVNHFGPVARQYSDDTASRYKGGVIGWLKPGRDRAYQWDPQVLEAVYALHDPGELGPVVRTDEGLYLVRLVDRQESAARSLNLIKDGLRARLLREKQQRAHAELLGEVLQGLDIEINRELLESIEPPQQDDDLRTKQPPVLPGN